MPSSELGGVLVRARLRLPTLSVVVLCSVVLLGCADDAASPRAGDPLPSVRIAGDERTVDVLVSEHCADGVCGQVSLAGATPDLGASGPLAVHMALSLGRFGKAAENCATSLAIAYVIRWSGSNRVRS